MYQLRYISHTLNTIRINGKTLSTIIKLSFTVNNYFQLIGLVLGQRPLGAILHSSNEPGELSQWFCHDDSHHKHCCDYYFYHYYYSSWSQMKIQNSWLFYYWLTSDVPEKGRKMSLSFLKAPMTYTGLGQNWSQVNRWQPTALTTDSWLVSK